MAQSTKFFLLLSLLFAALSSVTSFTTSFTTVMPRSSTAFSPTTTTPRLESSTQLFGKKAARAQGNERKNKTERVRKVKDDVIEVEAVVLESLPNAMFRCAIDGAPDTQEPVLATISAMPVVELRGAVPVGIWMGLPIQQVLPICVLTG